MNKIRKGDDVIVLVGRDKGKLGAVVRVAGDRVFVESVNMIKRHTKPNPVTNDPGGIIEKEASIHVSNVALYDRDSQRGARVGFKILKDGRKVRYFKSSGEVLDAV